MIRTSSEKKVRKAIDERVEKSNSNLDSIDSNSIIHRRGNSLDSILSSSRKDMKGFDEFLESKNICIYINE